MRTLRPERPAGQEILGEGRQDRRCTGCGREGEGGREQEKVNAVTTEDMERRVVFISERAYSTTVNGIQRIESQSILSRTLLLFGAAFGAVAASFGLVLWWVLRRGREPRRT